MGSVVVSDVGPDIPRYPAQSMVIGDLDNHSHHTAPTAAAAAASAASTGSSEPPRERFARDATSSQHQSASFNHNTSSSSSPHQQQQQQQRQASNVVATNSTSGSTASSRLPPLATAAVASSANAGVTQAADPSAAPTRREEQSQTPQRSTFQSPERSEGYDQAGFPLTSQPRGLTSSPPSPRLLPTVRSTLSFTNSRSGSPNRIKVRDLNHIQSFASEEVLALPQSHRGNGVDSRPHRGPRPNSGGAPGREDGHQYEISDMPVKDIIEMVAGLLTKITTTNDRQHQQEQLHRSQNPSQHIPAADSASAFDRQKTSVLSFHGKNVPSITILSYLSRIHKYCPTTYEVFISLLVYFDRMMEILNKGTLGSFRSAARCANQRDIMSPAPSSIPPPAPAPETGESSNSSGGKHGSSAPVAAEKQQEQQQNQTQSTQSSSQAPLSSSSSADSNAEPDSSQSSPPDSADAGGQPDRRTSTTSASTADGEILDEDASASSPQHCFVVDSFNIHRLVIAGVTCASKFFSDVFYTNSRYAKVGGLPIQELNHLETQFLLLNDFRLSVPVEELEAYGSRLVKFYAEEVMTQQQQQQQQHERDRLHSVAREQREQTSANDRDALYMGASS